MYQALPRNVRTRLMSASKAEKIKPILEKEFGLQLEYDRECMSLISSVQFDEKLVWTRIDQLLIRFHGQC